MSKDKELKIYESKVRSAMEGCPDAKEALGILFAGQLTPQTQVKAKKGDVIELLEDFNWLKAGDQGVVVDEDCTGVYWNRRSPKDRHSCKGLCPGGYGWYVKGAQYKILIPKI